MTQRFYTGHLGFVAAREPDVAVCLREGTQLVLRDIPGKLQRRLEVGEEAVASFAFLTTPRRWWNFLSLDIVDNDGLIFENGKSILISKLPERLKADVLSTHLTAPLEAGKQHEAPGIDRIL